MKKLLCAMLLLMPLLSLNSVIHQIGAYYADYLYYGNICVDGNKAYVTDATQNNSTGFIILDVSNPANPFLLGTVNDPHELHAIGVYANRAYIAADDAGLQVWDVSVPGSPSLLNTYYLGGICEELSISGDKLFVSVNTIGLKIYSIAEAVPLLLGSYDSVAPDDISIVGNLAYLADSNYGLRILNITNPAECFQVGAYPLLIARSLVVEGSTLFLTDCHNDSYIIDVSNPASPVFLSELPDMWIKLAYLCEGYLFAMVNNPGVGSRMLKVFDLSNPSQPQYCSCVVVPSYGTSIDVHGDNLYITVNSTGVIVFDISEIANTSLIVTSNIPANAIAMELINDMLYIADDEQRLLQLDISNSADPQLVSQLSFPYSISDMVIDAGMAYLTTYEDGLHIIRISDDNPPQQTNFEVLGNWPTENSAIEICLRGDLAYIANQEKLSIVDVSRETAPQTVGEYQNPAYSDFCHVAKYQNYVYGAGWSDFVSIMDVTNPANPFMAGTFLNPSITDNLLIYDHYLFQSLYMLPIRIYDLSNPVYPSLVGVLSISPAEYSYPFIFGHYLFLSLPAANNIKCYNISNPASPVLVKDYYWNLPTYDLVYRDGLLYTCNGEYGFSILNMDLSSSNQDPHLSPELVNFSAYPNPFSAFTTLSFKVEENQKVELEIYNLKGQLVSRVFTGTVQNGTHTINWNGTDAQGRMLGSGVYIARLKTGQKSTVRRIVKVN